MATGIIVVSQLQLSGVVSFVKLILLERWQFMDMIVAPYFIRLSPREQD